MKNLNNLFVILSYLAETKNDISFAMDFLVETYGPVMRELSGIRKAAKKAVKRINGDWLNPEDILAMEAKFLDKLGLYGAEEGSTITFENRVYVFENGKWEFDCLINPSVHGDIDGNAKIAKVHVHPFVAKDPIKTREVFCDNLAKKVGEDYDGNTDIPFGQKYSK